MLTVVRRKLNEQISVKGVEEMDRENLIDALALIAWNSEPKNAQTITEAISLLKEQEAVKPRWIRDIIYPAGAFACGACRERIVEKGIDFYCSKCGRAVKWE